jgi:hypothetical protein
MYTPFDALNVVRLRYTFHSPGFKLPPPESNKALLHPSLEVMTHHEFADAPAYCCWGQPPGFLRVVRPLTPLGKIMMARALRLSLVYSCTVLPLLGVLTYCCCTRAQAPPERNSEKYLVPTQLLPVYGGASGSGGEGGGGGGDAGCGGGEGCGGGDGGGRGGGEGEGGGDGGVGGDGGGGGLGGGDGGGGSRCVHSLSHHWSREADETSSPSP